MVGECRDNVFRLGGGFLFSEFSLVGARQTDEFIFRIHAGFGAPRAFGSVRFVPSIRGILRAKK